MLTTKELCEYFKIHENTVYNYIKKGLPFYKLSSKDYRFDLDEVKNWFKKNSK